MATSRDYKYVILQDCDHQPVLCIVPGTRFHFEAAEQLLQEGQHCLMSAGYFRLHDEETPRVAVFGSSQGYNIGPEDGDGELIRDILQQYRVKTLGADYDLRVAFSGTLRLVNRLVLNLKGEVLQ